MDHKKNSKGITSHTHRFLNNSLFKGRRGVRTMPLSEAFLNHFAELEDPRLDNHNKLHLLEDIPIVNEVAIIFYL